MLDLVLESLQKPQHLKKAFQKKTSPDVILFCLKNRCLVIFDVQIIESPYNRAYYND